jgi:thiol-disulfide isomerase/thioredoxin
MPRPPILEPLDLRSIHAAGRSWTEWLAIAEYPEHAERMKAAAAAIQLTPSQVAYLDAMPRTVNVIAIAEDWCGDVVRHAPVLAALAAECPTLNVRFVARTDSPELFKRFLTNGGEAIPKFIFLNDQFVECGNWGPMPAECRRLIARGKAAGDIGAARKRVSAMYAADPACETVIRELFELIEIASCQIP